MSPRFPTVLFDLDGTVIDSIALILASYRAALSAHAMPEVAEAEMRTWIGIPLETPFQRLAPEGWEPLVASYREHMAASHDEGVRATPGIGALISALEGGGAQVGVVTAKGRELARRGLDLAGLEGLPLLVAKEDTSAHKPDPAPLRRALELLGAPAQEAVYVGDAATDLAATRAAGIAGIGVTWGAGTRADLEAQHPLAVIDTAAELAGVLGVDPGSENPSGNGERPGKSPTRSRDGHPTV